MRTLAILVVMLVCAGCCCFHLKRGDVIHIERPAQLPASTNRVELTPDQKAALLFRTVLCRLAFNSFQFVTPHKLRTTWEAAQADQELAVVQWKKERRHE